MTIGYYCNREVVVTSPDTSILEAAQLMRKHHVGTLIVTEKVGGEAVPKGIVTDRDLVVEVMAPGVDPDQILVADIMGEKLFTAQESDCINDTMRLMRGHGIRRVPVVDDRGVLQGIVSVDDMIVRIAEETQELSKLIVHQQAREGQLRK